MPILEISLPLKEKKKPRLTRMGDIGLEPKVLPGQLYVYVTHASLDLRHTHNPSLSP